MQGAGTQGICFTTDASGSWGCAGHWEHPWFQLPWDEESRSFPIIFKELIPIILTMGIWGPEWQGKDVTCRCDNMAVASAVTLRSSHNSEMMHLLWCLFYIEALYGFGLRCVHLPGVENTRADALSRDNISSFRLQVPEADLVPQALPKALVQALLQMDKNWLSPAWRDQLISISGRTLPNPPTAPTVLG